MSWPTRDDRAQNAFAQDCLARPKQPSGSEIAEKPLCDGDLLPGVGLRFDRDARGIAHYRDELLVDVGVLLHFHEIDYVRVRERREPLVERHRDDLVVNARREYGMRTAPDRQSASGCRGTA